MAHKTLRLDPAESGLSNPVVLIVDNIAALRISNYTYNHGLTGGATVDGVPVRWDFTATWSTEALLVGGGDVEVGMHEATTAILDYSERDAIDAVNTLARGKAEAWLERVQARLEEALAE